MEWMDRFVTIMDVVSAENERGIGVTTLANETGLSKGTLDRILQDMVHYKLIVQVPETKKYYLGPRSMIWGSCFVKGRDVSTILSPFCDDIAERTQLYAYICRYVTNEVYCIYTHQPLQEHKTTYFVHVGQRMPLHASAAAKAILAHQPQDMVKYLLDQSSWQIFTAHTAKRVADLMEELETVRKEKVAWCRETEHGYELGVEFLDQDDAFRARMVEQICHIETYREQVQQTEHRDLSPEQAAHEWISKFAEEFPDPESDSLH